MSKAVEVHGLRMVYQGRGRSVEALADLTFSVEASELVCVVGPSGCGKTTMLRCIAGLLEPTAGEVLLEGARVAGPPPGMAAVGLDDVHGAAVGAQTRAELEDLVRSVWRRTGVTIVFLTHDMDEAVYLGERVLSSSPTVVQEDLPVDLPEARDQLTTRSDPRFTRLRGHVYAHIQQAKRDQGRATPPSPEGAAAAPGT